MVVLPSPERFRTNADIKLAPQKGPLYNSIDIRVVVPSVVKVTELSPINVSIFIMDPTEISLKIGDIVTPIRFHLMYTRMSTVYKIKII